MTTSLAMAVEHERERHRRLRGVHHWVGAEAPVPVDPPDVDQAAARLGGHDQPRGRPVSEPTCPGKVRKSSNAGFTSPIERVVAVDRMQLVAVEPITLQRALAARVHDVDQLAGGWRCWPGTKAARGDDLAQLQAVAFDPEHRDAVTAGVHGEQDAAAVGDAQ